MSDGQVMAKIQSWSRKNRTEKLSEHNSTLNVFLSPNGSEFGFTYFNEECFPINLVYFSIGITQFGLVMAKLWPKYSHGVLKTE